MISFFVSCKVLTNFSVYKWQRHFTSWKHATQRCPNLSMNKIVTVLLWTVKRKVLWLGLFNWFQLVFNCYHLMFGVRVAESDTALTFGKSITDVITLLFSLQNRLQHLQFLHLGPVKKKKNEDKCCSVRVRTCNSKFSWSRQVSKVNHVC